MQHMGAAQTHLNLRMVAQPDHAVGGVGAITTPARHAPLIADGLHAQRGAHGSVCVVPTRLAPAFLLILEAAAEPLLHPLGQRRGHLAWLAVVGNRSAAGLPVDEQAHRTDHDHEP